MNTIQISDSEWLVMKVIWETPSVSAEDIFFSKEDFRWCGLFFVVTLC